MNNHTEVEVAALPYCDLCAANGKQELATVDGKTMFGPWANMCDMHHEHVGVGLGLGRGQRLKLRQAGQA